MTNNRPQIWAIVVAISVILGIIGSCITIYEFPTFFRSNQSTGTTQNSTNTPIQVEPASCSTPCSVYQENGSDNWNGWLGSADWHIDNGQLKNDGSGDPDHWIKAPYQPGNINDYVVEAEIKVVSGCWTFGIVFRATSQGNYAAGIYCQSNVDYAAIWVWNGPGSYTLLKYQEFDAGTNIHPYRVEVTGSNIKLSIDGNNQAEVTDSQFTSGGQVGIFCDNMQIALTSFNVLTM